MLYRVVHVNTQSHKNKIQTGDEGTSEWCWMHDNSWCKRLTVACHVHERTHVTVNSLYFGLRKIYYTALYLYIAKAIKTEISFWGKGTKRYWVGCMTSIWSHSLGATWSKCDSLHLLHTRTKKIVRIVRFKFTFYMYEAKSIKTELQHWGNWGNIRIRVGRKHHAWYSPTC